MTHLLLIRTSLRCALPCDRTLPLLPAIPSAIAVVLPYHRFTPLVLSTRRITYFTKNPNQLPPPQRDGRVSDAAALEDRRRARLRHLAVTYPHASSTVEGISRTDNPNPINNSSPVQTATAHASHPQKELSPTFAGRTVDPPPHPPGTSTQASEKTQNTLQEPVSLPQTPPLAIPEPKPVDGISHQPFHAPDGKGSGCVASRRPTHDPHNLRLRWGRDRGSERFGREYPRLFVATIASLLLVLALNWMSEDTTQSSEVRTDTWNPSSSLLILAASWVAFTIFSMYMRSRMWAKRNMLCCRQKMTRNTRYHTSPPPAYAASPASDGPTSPPPAYASSPASDGPVSPGPDSAPSLQPVSVAVPASMRRTTIREMSHSVTGTYPLYELVDIKTMSGAISITVDPQPVDGPAEIRLSTMSGSIRLDLANSGKIPNREYKIKVSTMSGSIRGSIMHGGGGRTHLSTMSGNIDMDIHPVRVGDDQSNLYTSSMSGSTNVTVKSPQGGGMMTNLQASHKSKGSGSLRIEFHGSGRGQ